MKTRLSAFTQALADFGWTVGRNLRMDLRWAGGDINRIRALVQELVSLQPDIILTGGYAATAAVQRETRTIPIVFANVSDPVASGIVARLDRPNANVAPVHSDVEIESAIIALGCEPEGGLVVISDAFTFPRRAPIVLAAARNNVPAVYMYSDFVKEGGLLSYGVDQVDIYRRAAAYVGRILRGAKPSELPVQLPTKFEMAVNLKDRQGAWPCRTHINTRWSPFPFSRA
jgi:putative tryptophan/tyrosine transport system substrate-binding protein